MEESRRSIYTEIYCKIYTDNFEPLYGVYNGKEIFDFLLKSAKCSFYPYNSSILYEGDLNLWYLGCNEKFGGIVYGDKNLEWNSGGSFDYIQKFIDDLYSMKIFNDNEYKILNEKIQEGRKINDMYEIGRYLYCKENGIEFLPIK